MKRISNFKIFESNQWWAGKLSQYDIEREELARYFNYLTDEYEVSLNIDVYFYNMDFEIIMKKNDLLSSDYYIGYNLTIVNRDRISDPNNFIKYHEYLMNGINSLSRNYKIKIINHSKSSTIIKIIDESQTLTKNDFQFKKSPKSLMESIKMKVERINKICHIIDNEEFPEENIIYLKERKGTSAERLEEILLKMFSDMISENIVKVNKTSKKIRLNSKKEYEFVHRLDRSFPRIQHKSVFEISLI
jgi:hypothetical protein